MQTRAKALTVTIAVVLAFAVLPTLGAAAAEPLPDGSYEIVLADATYTLSVVDGEPSVDGPDGVDFQFRFDATGRVLDEFEVGVGDDAHAVEVTEDGSVKVDGDLADEEPGQLLEFDEVVVEEAPADEDDADEDEVEDDTDEDEVENDGNHGALVSSVAQCAPSGKVARDAGLPNHGTFARAAARGEAVEFEVDGETYTADLSSPEGAAAFCSLAAELVAAADAPDAQDSASDEGADDESGQGGRGNGNGNGKDNGNGNGNGRANAPGQLKKND